MDNDSNGGIIHSFFRMMGIFGYLLLCLRENHEWHGYKEVYMDGLSGVWYRRRTGADYA